MSSTGSISITDDHQCRDFLLSIDDPALWIRQCPLDLLRPLKTKLLLLDAAIDAKLTELSAQAQPQPQPQPAALASSSKNNSLREASLTSSTKVQTSSSENRKSLDQWKQVKPQSEKDSSFTMGVSNPLYAEKGLINNLAFNPPNQVSTVVPTPTPTTTTIASTVPTPTSTSTASSTAGYATQPQSLQDQTRSSFSASSAVPITTVVTNSTPSNTNSTPINEKKQKGNHYVAVETYEALTPDELGFEKGDVITFWEADESGWAYGTSNNNKGWFPFSYVQLETQPPSVVPTPTPPATEVILPAPVSPTTSTDVESFSILQHKNIITNKLTSFLGGKRVEKKSLEEKNILPDTKNTDPTLLAAQNNLSKTQKKDMLTNLLKMTHIKDDKKKEEVFGLPLEKVLQVNDKKSKSAKMSYIPNVVSDCVHFLDKPERLKVEGIFRISPNKDDLEKMKANTWKSISATADLDQICDDPHMIASILKSFFSSLPEPIFTYGVCDEIFTSKLHDKNDIPFLQSLMGKLPALNRMVIDYLFGFLKRVSDQSQLNKMTPNNLAIVWAPNLIRAKVETSEILRSRLDAAFIEQLLSNYDSIFK